MKVRDEDPVRAPRAVVEDINNGKPEILLDFSIDGCRHDAGTAEHGVNMDNGVNKAVPGVV